MRKEIGQALTRGLAKGYAGQSEVRPISRTSFNGKVSHVEDDEFEYHDEWFVASHLGGGQELVRVGEVMFTRVYAGGTPSPELLVELGITIKDISAYLKRKIIELEDKTRLFEECLPEPDGKWQYRYEIVMKDPNIPVVVSTESITYEGVRVHLHPFILSPVE